MAGGSPHRGSITPLPEVVPQRAHLEVQCHQHIDQASQHVQVEITTLANNLALQKGLRECQPGQQGP